METKHLGKWVKEMVTCTQCGYCKEVCPVFDQVGWDSSVARGKMALAYGLYTGDIEPDESVLRIRQRIDGVLHEHVMKEVRIASALVLRLKLMSGLNISEKRLPQDGRFNIRIQNRSVDVRLSTMPIQPKSWATIVLSR